MPLLYNFPAHPVWFHFVFQGLGGVKWAPISGEVATQESRRGLHGIRDELGCGSGSLTRRAVATPT